MKNLFLFIGLIVATQLQAQFTVAVDDVFQFNSGMQLKEISAPATPGTAYGILYLKSDGHLYFKNDAGTEFDLLELLIESPNIVTTSGTEIGTYGPNFIQLESTSGGAVTITKGDGATDYSFALPVDAPEEGQTLVMGAADQMVWTDVLGGSVPLDRALTINGTTQDLAADRTWTVGNLRSENNLSDIGTASTARTNLGLGTAAVQNIAAFLQPSNNLSDVTTPSTARTNLGLGSIALLSVITETNLSFTDVTTANVSTSAHGLMPKLPNDAAKFFDGAGSYTVPFAGALGASVGGNNITASTTAYAPILGQTNFNATEAARQFIMPAAGTIKNLYVRTGNSQPGTGAITVTVRKNGSATVLTTTVTAGAGAGTFSNTANSFTFVAGDLISIEFANAASSGSANIVSWSVQYTN